MNSEKAAVTSDAADIVEVCASSVGRGNEVNQLGGAFWSGKRVQRGVRDGDLLLEVLRVHHRNLLRDCDCLLTRPDLQVGIYGRGESGRQFDAVPLQRAEARQGEG